MSDRAFSVGEATATEHMGLLSQFCRLLLPIAPPAGTDPTALLRWAGSFQGLQSGDLCRIARAQAAITDWPSVEFTLVQARRVPYETKDHLEHRIAATRWVVDQIRHGADPPTLGDDKYAATRWFDDGPPPKTVAVSLAWVIRGAHSCPLHCRRTVVHRPRRAVNQKIPPHWTVASSVPT